jgi:hypothetical protein
MGNNDCNITERGINGIPVASTILDELWERTADTLTTKELEWFANSIDYTQMQGDNLSEVISGIGCEIGSGDFGSFNDKENLATLLFSISHQVDTISGMMRIAASAQRRLYKPEIYSMTRKSEVHHA